MKNSTTCKREERNYPFSYCFQYTHSLKIREYAFQCFIIATLSRYVDYLSLWVQEMSEVEHAWWVDFLDTYIRAHTFTTHIYKLTCIEWILFFLRKMWTNLKTTGTEWKKFGLFVVVKNRTPPAVLLLPLLGYMLLLTNHEREERLF